MSKILKYFLQGLILFIPIGITAIVLIKLFQFFEGLFSFIGLTGHPALDTLLVILLLLVSITLLGIMASSFVFRRLFSYLEDRVEHAPFIRHIYSPIKDFMNAFVGNKKRFTKPVMVLTNPQADIWEMGFVTHDDLKEFGMTDKVAVYLPYSYSLSGRLVFAPRAGIRPANIESSEAMKFIVSGGVTDVD